MATKNQVKVMIGGRMLTLGGYESEEYLERVASYLNHRITELEAVAGFKRLSPEIRSALIEINIADDYFKAKTRAEALENEIEAKDKEAYDLKHRLIALQIELDKLKGSPHGNNGKHDR